MKFVKLQKASIKRQAALTDEQVNYLKENYKYTMFDPDSNNDHNELERDMEYIKNERNRLNRIRSNTNNSINAKSSTSRVYA